MHGGPRVAAAVLTHHVRESAELFRREIPPGDLHLDSCEALLALDRHVALKETVEFTVIAVRRRVRCSWGGCVRLLIVLEQDAVQREVPLLGPIAAQLVIGIVILPMCMWLVNRPRPYLAGFILAFVVSGIFSINSSLWDIGFVLLVGFVGYLMRKNGFPFLPAVLGVVLGPLVESNYRRSLLLSGGDHGIFLEDPIAIGFLIAAAVFVVWSLAREMRDAQMEKRQEATT